MDIQNSEAVIGAEVRGIDLLAPLGDAEFERLADLVDARSVVCLRNQDLTPECYVDFARRFGGIEISFLADYAMAGHPEILLVSNIRDAEGREIGHSDAGRVWHTDMSFTATPPRLTMLHAREVPVRDGVTLGATDFASAAAAHDFLPEETQRRLGDMMVVHDVFGRRAKSGSHKQQDDLRKRQAKVTHPFVRRHPRTGRKCLYVNQGECVAIAGMEDGEATALIEEMAALIPSPAFRYRHQWAVGDMLIWDNCAVQHRANFDYRWPAERRLMWRITVDGKPTS